MDIAILLFDRFTALDAVGPYEVLSRLPGAKVTFVAARAGEVRTDVGSLGLTADASIDDVDRADILVVPGGAGTRDLIGDPVIDGWIRAIDETTAWTTSVCTGALSLASAGVLDGLEATTHWAFHDTLRELGAIPVDRRVVFSGKRVTAAGVSAGIDMGLRLAAAVAGEPIAQTIQLGIEYDPDPPFTCGSPRTAPAPIRQLAEQALRRG